MEKEIFLNEILFRDYKTTLLDDVLRSFILFQNILFFYLKKEDIKKIEQYINTLVVNNKKIKLEKTVFSNFFPENIGKIFNYFVKNHPSISVVDAFEEINIFIKENNKEFVIS